VDKTFCIFGDSVTQAAYVNDDWVNHFQHYLEKKYHNDFINVFNLGIGGNTSDDILKRFRVESEFRQPSDIIFAFGINDSGYFYTPDKPIVPEDRFIKNVKELINQAKKYTSKILFVGLTLGDDSILKPTPGISQGKSYDFKRVENYNNILKEISQANLCQFIPLLDKLGPSDFIDGLHPNEQGHLKIFEGVKKQY